VRVAGSGTAVVCLHGVTDNLATWHGVQSALREVAETHAVDLPGHGLSDIPVEPRSVAEQADAVIAYLTAAGIGRCVLVGNSMGGGVALGVAARAPDRVARVVLLGSIGVKFPAPTGLILLRYPMIAEQMQRFATSTAMQRMALRDTFAPGFRASDAAVESYWRGWRVEGRPAYLRSLLRVLEADEPAKWLPTIRAHVIVAHGSHDQMIPVHVAESITAALPNARKVILHGVGHQPQIEAPADVVAFVREALASPV